MRSALASTAFCLLFAAGIATSILAPGDIRAQPAAATPDTTSPTPVAADKAALPPADTSPIDARVEVRKELEAAQQRLHPTVTSPRSK